MSCLDMFRIAGLGFVETFRSSCCGVNSLKISNVVDVLYCGWGLSESSVGGVMLPDKNKVGK